MIKINMSEEKNMSNWAKDYLKYSNETGGGSSGGGPVGNNGPGCAGIFVFILLFLLIVDLLTKM